MFRDVLYTSLLYNNIHAITSHMEDGYFMGPDGSNVRVSRENAVFSRCDLLTPCGRTRSNSSTLGKQTNKPKKEEEKTRAQRARANISLAGHGDDREVCVSFALCSQYSLAIAMYIVRPVSKNSDQTVNTYVADRMSSSFTTKTFQFMYVS